MTSFGLFSSLLFRIFWYFNILITFWQVFGLFSPTILATTYNYRSQSEIKRTNFEHCAIFSASILTSATSQENNCPNHLKKVDKLSVDFAWHIYPIVPEAKTLPLSVPRWVFSAKKPARLSWRMPSCNHILDVQSTQFALIYSKSNMLFLLFSIC